ncbi:hypothetical protein GCM10023194_48940 [Planotetraspora phitsanulokensis]|uniref:Uncharacterized protein n=1 Tax=Planotetraspora phitsanulokensis TaxID=575192 RepID=A0A8J3UED5_9ACTN|nr:hypothetical protein [Planotetraspora phitsanulokensis]GII42117.1 hypothetical protein Pph01_71200 [Planotetraspora phitsanulokensis]
MTDAPDPRLLCREWEPFTAISQAADLGRADVKGALATRYRVSLPAWEVFAHAPLWLAAALDELKAADRQIWVDIYLGLDGRPRRIEAGVSFPAPNGTAQRSLKLSEDLTQVGKPILVQAPRPEDITVTPPSGLFPVTPPA